MSTNQRRTTQRIPKSCVYCARRKLRCSKSIPCLNCIERGMMDRCHRESVILSNQSLRQKDPGSRPSSLEPPSDQTSSSSGGRPIVPLAKRGHTTTSSLRRTSSFLGQIPRTATNAQLVPDCRELHQTQNFINTRDASGAAQDDVENRVHSEITHEGELATEAAMSLESLAWGTHREQTSNVIPLTDISALVEELQDLVNTNTARAILVFHRDHVAWMHNVVYMPLFLRECENGLHGRLQQDSAWLSLYCAVICTGIYYMTKSQHSSLGLQNGYDVSRKLYQLTIEMIMKSDFMVIQSINSLQAISVILLCAHSFGDERRMKVLLSCANSIAQSPCHRLNRQDSSTSPQLSFRDQAEREISKRVWCFLCIQDWYLIGSKKSYSIFPNHGTTPRPANCREDFDDATQDGTFLDLPLSVPTQSTYMIFLFKFTSQYRALYDRLCAIDARGGSVADCFCEVLLADNQLEAIMNEISDIEQISAGIEQKEGQGLASQRQALVIANWHQRLMIHRSFFCRSFQDRRYYYSRFVSVAAARNILRSYLDSARPQILAEIWTIPTHAISGCIIMTLNSLFTVEKYTLESSDMELMHQCLALLKDSPRPSSIVERGIQIIQYLLSQGSLDRFRTLDPNEISQLARKINVTAPQGHPDIEVNAENSFAETEFPQLDFLDQVNGYLADNDLLTSYFDDPTLQWWSQVES